MQLSHLQKSNEALYKKELTELENEKEALEGRFAFGKISEELYRKFQAKIEDEIIKLKENNESTHFEISDLQKHLEKPTHLIRNISKYWASGNLDVKRRIQRLVFPGGFYIDPVNRQYLTDKVNSLFRLNVELSRVSGDDKKRIPIKNDKDSVSVHYSDEISDREIMRDLVDVVDLVIFIIN